MTRIFAIGMLATMAAISGWPGSAGAQFAGAASLQIPASVRSEGMGGSYAPLERSAQAAWGNPGALGLVRGFDARYMRARLVPDLAEDVIFDNQALVFGLGIDFGDVPLIVNAGYNRTHLDYGVSILTGPGSPDPIGTFTSFEEVNGWTLALGVGEFFGVGVGIKRVDGDLASGVQGVDGTFEATAYDYGMLARTPAFPFRRRGVPEPAWSVSLVGGIAWLNRGDDVKFAGAGSDPLPRVRRESIGIELDILPLAAEFPTGNRWLSRLLRDAHLVSLTGVLGRKKDLLAPYEAIPDSILADLTDDAINGITNNRGIEIRFLDSLSFRWGHLDDEAGQIIGDTFGWGFSLLGYAGVDWAEIPQFHELDRVQKWSFWVRVPLDARI